MQFTALGGSVLGAIQQYAFTNATWKPHAANVTAALSFLSAPTVIAFQTKLDLIKSKEVSAALTPALIPTVELASKVLSTTGANIRQIIKVQVVQPR